MSTCVEEVKRMATRLHPLPKGYANYVIASWGGGCVLWLQPNWSELNKE